LTAISAADAGAAATTIAARLTAAAKYFFILVSPLSSDKAPNYAYPTMRTLACKPLLLPLWRVIRVEPDVRNRMATPTCNSYARQRALLLIAGRRLVVVVFISEPSVDL
jgi:hypothetical protein